MHVTVPDTITTWQVNAVGISDTGIFGMASPQRLRVFSPIFLEVTLPYSVIRNEQFVVKATVYNYNPVTTVDNVSQNSRAIRNAAGCISISVNKRNGLYVKSLELQRNSSTTLVERGILSW